MRPQFYRQYSFDCLRLANTTSDPDTRSVLVDMAQAWLKLAEQANSLPGKRYRHLILVSDNTTKEIA